jgi:predicted transcriptional regulator YdeE
MKSTQLKQERDIVIIGSPLRTDPARAAAEIPAHWQRFHGDELAAKIPALAEDPHLYCVYCDYESDNRGPYTMVIGRAVARSAEVPPGLRRVTLPSGVYAAFHLEGDPTQAITATWNFINQRWDGSARRRYIADFERYRPDAMSPTRTEGDIFVGYS